VTLILDETHDPTLTSWVASANGHADFPIQNLPLGVFSPPEGEPRGGVAIGDMILDLSIAAAAGLMGRAQDAAAAGAGRTLNPLLALPSSRRRALRHRLSALLAAGAPEQAEVESWLHPATDCTLHLPARIGDYTDFYAGIHHATNVGRLFRPDDPLLPNYKHVPIGYHGRASSVRVSGTPVRRPNGQRLPPGETAPVFGLSRRLDLELELGVWLGEGNALGEPIAIDDADDHIAGLCLLNDWSARDLQAWEYQPLGPFLAKNFMTTVSPWIVTAEALAPFRIAQPPRPEGDPTSLPYLLSAEDQTSGAYAITLDVLIQTPAMRQAGLKPHRLGSGPAANLYWTLAQLVTHHASGGCDLNPGDLLGTGTISTPDDSGVGSLLELTRGGKQPIALPGGETRAFLEDGDWIGLAGRAVADGYVSLGFGPCEGVIAPAIPIWP
jgi:fumarylacetoacetase